MRDNARWAGQMSEIDATYRKATQALVTIAGVNCLSNLQGAAKLEKRDALLKRKELMPKAVQELLMKLK